MLATMTSKGQVTLPKEIRERLGLDAGSTLDFEVQPDNSITVRAVKANALSVRGLLKSPHAKALSVEQMDAGLATQLTTKHKKAAR